MEESQRKRSRNHSKQGAKPEARRFVQVKTVVMDSDAWRDCDHTSHDVYFRLSANLKWAFGMSEPTNNGHLWISRGEWEKAKFAPATVTRCLKQLIRTGLIYRTHLGGIGRGCSSYALTCYSLSKDTEGINPKGFLKDAWAKYVCSTECSTKKSRESNLNRRLFKSDELPPQNGDKEIKFEPTPRIKFEHQESESTIYPYLNGDTGNDSDLTNHLDT